MDLNKMGVGRLLPLIFSMGVEEFYPSQEYLPVLSHIFHLYNFNTDTNEDNAEE